ncbi:MAG: hypothetical protein ABIS18_12005 [Actinomycetota bacterium]
MSQIHDHGSTVVVEDSRSSALLIGLALIAGIVLVWAIFFSGWVIDRGPDTVNIDRTTEGDTNVDVNNPNPGETTAPSTAPSPPPATTAP